MPDSVFVLEGERYHPTVHAGGPWDPRALHGGAPAALITSAFEAHEPGSELRIARLGFEFLRPIPMAPLTLTLSVARSGRRVQELAAELHADRGAGEPELVCRAGALRVQQVPAGLPAAAGADDGGVPAMPALQDTVVRRFGLNADARDSFAASAMEMRWAADPWTLGPGQVWQRLQMDLLAGVETTPLARLAASSDFGNGISASLPFEDYLFINADLHVHIHRPPVGEWIGLDARTQLQEGGAGLAESILHDGRGAVGRAFQTLVVQRR
jgi:hypothetical protein